MPRSKLVRCGVWEDGQFIGVVMFGAGATPEIGKQFGLTKFEMCELVRIALREHVTPVSRLVSISLRQLSRELEGLRLVVSFADSARGHNGAIYQASNWVYTGAKQYHAYRVCGAVVHPRVLHLRYGIGGQSVPWLRAHVDPKAERITTPAKHRYLYPLDRAMRRQIAPLAQPYPKRADG